MEAQRLNATTLLNTTTQIIVMMLKNTHEQHQQNKAHKITATKGNKRTMYTKPIRTHSTAA